MCHDHPSQKSVSKQRVFVGRNIITTRTADSEGVTWYFADQYSLASQVCWVYGPYTTEARPERNYARDTEADWLAVVAHMLARTDVAFEEYVDLNNFLTSNARINMPGSNSALLQFLRLQMLDKAAAAAGRDGWLVSAPLKFAWLIEHLEYDEIAAEWYVPPKRYWDLFDANPDEPWAEEAAWRAEQAHIPVDECYSDCILDLIVRQPLQYWKRLPAGAHIRETLARGAELAKAASDGACYDLDPAHPGRVSTSPVPPATVAEIRGSLTTISNPEKQDILRFLADAERKCGR